MGYKKRTIVLTEDERRYLKEYAEKGVKPIQAVKRAQILLEADSSKGRKPAKEGDIAEKVGVSLPTVKLVKKAFYDHHGDVEMVVIRKKREMGPREIKMTGDVEARLIALCCSSAPEGYARWTVRLLADKMVELNYIDEISPMTVSRTLKKTSSNLI
jgi:hypothetical protein